MIVSAKLSFLGEEMNKQIRRTSLGIEEELYKQLEKIAEEERRSVSQMANVLIEEALQARKKEKDRKEKDV